MNLDDILAMASVRTPTKLERARTARAGRRGFETYRRATAEGHDLLGEIDVGDPLAPAPDEATRMARFAQSAKLGRVTWQAGVEALSWSDEMALLCGEAPGAVAVSSRLLERLIHPDDRAMVATTLAKAWHHQTPSEFAFRLLRADKSMRYVQCLAEILAGGAGVVATVQDVTEAQLARREQQRLRRRQTITAQRPPGRDPLTGLLGRESFTDAVDTAARSGRGVLLLVGIEPTGRTGALSDADTDQVSRIVAGMLRNITRRGVCGLVEATEFGILLTEATAEEAIEVSGAVVRSLRDQLTLTSSAGVRLLAWGGVAPFTARDRAGGRELLASARAAWRRGRREDTEVAVEPVAGEAGPHDQAARDEIITTVAGDRLCLYAQPIRDLTLNQITRHEVLLRVLDAKDRPGSPETFLAAAERVGEVPAVDRWVVDRALARIGAGPQTSHHQINLSGQSISRPGLLAHIRQALDRYGVEPDRITFEITESAGVDNLTAAVEFADGVTRAGCLLALDDFGTGHAPLRLLKHLPIDLVKIDGSFVTGLRHDLFDQTTVRSTVDMCRKLGIRTAAEYVQDEATADLLRDYGVDFAQGYAIGRPVPMASADSGVEFVSSFLGRMIG